MRWMWYHIEEWWSIFRVANFYITIITGFVFHFLSLSLFFFVGLCRRVVFHLFFSFILAKGAYWKPFRSMRLSVAAAILSYQSPFSDRLLLFVSFSHFCCIKWSVYSNGSSRILLIICIHIKSRMENGGEEMGGGGTVSEGYECNGKRVFGEQ